MKYLGRDPIYGSLLFIIPEHLDLTNKQTNKKRKFF